MPEKLFFKEKYGHMAINVSYLFLHKHFRAVYNLVCIIVHTDSISINVPPFIFPQKMHLRSLHGRREEQVL